MYTFNSPKNILAMVLILAVSCAPLFAKKPRTKQHRSIEAKKARVQKFSKKRPAVALKSEADEDKLSRGRARPSAPRIEAKKAQVQKISKKRPAVALKPEVNKGKVNRVRARSSAPRTGIARRNETTKKLRKPTKRPRRKSIAVVKKQTTKVVIEQSRPRRPNRNISKTPTPAPAPTPAPVQVETIAKVVNVEPQRQRREIVVRREERKTVERREERKTVARRNERKRTVSQTPTVTIVNNTSINKAAAVSRPANKRKRHVRSESRDRDKGVIRTRPRRRSHRKNRSPKVTHRKHVCTSNCKCRTRYVYRGSRNQQHYRAIRPRHNFNVYYSRRGYAFNYIYPNYHRKYVFVSLGGYWPTDYRYVRYYWYGHHPYHWYDYHPNARKVKSSTYNYYTYNYYSADDIDSDEYAASEDIYDHLARQDVEEPYDETLADNYFEQAVKAFELGDYDTAVDNFAEAMALAPDDIVLPFAYAQALFADEKYYEAAEIFRLALAKIPPDEEGVFYPRGLYLNDETLLEQIDHLTVKADLYSFDGDLQLLLGYQLLGIGEIDQASEHLRQARLDFQNTEAAVILLDVLEQTRIESD